MKKKLLKLSQDETFQKKIKDLKPKRNFWGALGIVIFFFVPEVVVVYWSVEMMAWVDELIARTPENALSPLLKWMSEYTFTGKVSYSNIILGIAALVWVFWEDIKRFLPQKD